MHNGLFERRAVVVGAVSAVGAVGLGGGLFFGVGFGRPDAGNLPCPTRVGGLDHFIPKVLISLGELLLDVLDLAAWQLALGRRRRIQTGGRC